MRTHDRRRGWLGMTRSAYHLVAALVTAIFTASGCSQGAVDSTAGDESDDRQVLVFASVPSDRTTNLKQYHQPILDMLEEETGKEVLFESGDDYATITEGLRDKKIDIAALGPFTYVLARQQGAQITVAAARVDTKGKVPGYQSYGITRTGSSIKNLADFRDKKVCFVDRDSTSGYLYPSARLLALGIEPEKDTIPIFAGRHDAVILAVANGQCDAGFALDRMVDQHLIAQDRLQPDQITTVWRSGTIPGPPIVITDNLDPELHQQLITAFQEKANADYLRANGFCEGECAIADGFAYGYQAADDADYDSVREICKMIQNQSCTEG